MKNTDTTVLVAIVPRKKDWEILKREHWYRIPVKSAPKNINEVKILAFYQPKIFGCERYSVNYYAQVKNLGIVKRIQLLPDEPNHIRANNDYYKITIGDLTKLLNPIPSQRWRRITFIPSTLERLLKATEINDLWDTSKIEEKLYKALKDEKVSSERQYFVYETEKPYCLDFAIFCKDGKLNIECDGEKYHSPQQIITRDRNRNNDLTSLGWSILRFSGKEINRDLPYCVRKIKRTIKTLNGIDSCSV